MAVTRETVCAKMGSVPEIPLEDFFAHFMPSQRLDTVQLEAVLYKLTHQDFPPEACARKKSRAAIWATDNAPLGVGFQRGTFWTDYVFAPADLSGSARVVDNDLVAIHGQIVQCCLEVDEGRTLKQTTTLRNNATRSLDGQELPLSVPDGAHQLLPDLGEEFDWHDIVIAEEYTHLRDCARSGLWDVDMAEDVEEPRQTATQQKLENAKKVIWSMHQIICTDSRRRFTFGITIANTEVRLWHYGHAVVVVSKPFDLNVNAKTLIDVYSRFAFATREELGFDPKIELIRFPTPPLGPKPPHQYRITICGHHYITVNTISNQSAENGIGRCTKVWTAYREGEDEDTLYAIKDSWLEAGRETEYDIYQDLMQAIDVFDWERCCHKRIKGKRLARYKGTEPIDPRYGLSKEERKAFFIPMYEGEKVEVAPGVTDNTETVIGRGYVLPQPKDRMMHSVHEHSVLAASQGLESGLVFVARPPDVFVDYPRWYKGRFLKDITAREHHRLVMAIGEKLLDIEEAKSMFSTVKDASYALFVLHMMGYVYRDVSAGNILQYRGKGVLTDLEYVAPAATLQAHNMRVVCSDSMVSQVSAYLYQGTPDFTAVEVVDGEFLREPRIEGGIRSILCRLKEPAHDEASQDSDSSSEDDDSYLEEDHDTHSESGPVWRFREAHDLESIYWLVLFILFGHRPAEISSPPDGYNPSAQLDRFNSMFPHYHFSTSIERVGVLKFDRHLVAALRLLPPKWRTIMSACLREVRRLLQEIYEACQGKPPPPTTWFCVHEMCAAGERIEDGLTPIVKEASDVVVRAPRLLARNVKTWSVQSSGKKRGNFGSSRYYHGGRWFPEHRQQRSAVVSGRTSMGVLTAGLFSNLS
ncbi:hypothetical protein EV121DRAFT_281620 [Schizophyllum commune]